MTSNIIIILELIKKSIWGLSYDISQKTDWNKVIEEAKSQAVLGLIIGQLPESKQINDQYIQMISFYAQYTYAEEELIKLFEDHSIPMVILKGAAAAVYYPEPYLRSFGDIDFFVPKKFFDWAKELMAEHGYKKVSQEKDEFRHIEFEKDGFFFELHHRFSYDDLDIDDYIEEGIKEREWKTIDDHRFPMLPSFSNGLVLLYHMRSHLQKGLGLRQVVDWMMYVNAVVDDEYWDTMFRPVSEKLGLETLATTTTLLCQKYLGLPKTIEWCKNADESLCDTLMESLLSSGNFGIKRGSEIKAEKTVTALKKEGIFCYLQKAGKHNWTAYHNHPILKPFCWIYQIFRYIRQAKQQKSSLRDSIKRGQQRYEMLKKLKVI